jgi:alpha-beta hydrolase superfamily lysophospholipase
MPTLIMWGALDRIIPVQHAVIAHEAMPGSQLEIFDSAGHFPHHEDPERFVKTIEAFLDGTIPQEFDQETWRAYLRSGRPRTPQVSSGS